jgi:hypothetical protein
VNSLYSQLANSQTMLKLYQQSYDLSKKSIQDILNQLSLPNPDPDGKLLTNALSVQNSLNSAFNRLYGTQAALVSIMFSIQQVAGTVFDDAKRELNRN